VILNSTGTNTGTIQAVGSSAVLSLQSSTITGGTFATSGGGTIATVFGTSSTVDKATINNASNLVVTDNSILTLGATVNNTGTVSLASAGNNAQLIADANGVTLQGKGTVALTDHSNNLIYGAAATDTLTNADNTISGAGQLGDAQLTLVNQSGGTINGSATTNALTINTGGSGSFSNAGTVEATGTGGLVIASSTVTNTGTIEALTNSTLNIQNSTITNTTGIIEAVGSGAAVGLGGATINGGTLATSSNGTIKTLFGTSSTVDKATINNANNLVVGDNSMLTLGSTVNNTGTHSLSSAGNNAQLIIDANGATLQGKGAVTLNDHSNDLIYGAAATDVLTNVDNTISGGGQLGDGQLTLVNQAGGTINGGGTTNALTLDTGSGSFSNAGIIESTGGKGLVIASSTGTNTGTIQAVGSSAVLYLQNSTITGGTFATSGGGTITTIFGTNSTVDKATINNAGTLQVTDNSTLNLGSTVNNTGTLSIASAGNNAEPMARRCKARATSR
jgi:hypothetical protein